jgi:hypothetical protein
MLEICGHVSGPADSLIINQSIIRVCALMAKSMAYKFKLIRLRHQMLHCIMVLYQKCTAGGYCNAAQYCNANRSEYQNTSWQQSFECRRTPCSRHRQRANSHGQSEFSAIARRQLPSYSVARPCKPGDFPAWDQ